MTNNHSSSSSSSDDFPMLHDEDIVFQILVWLPVVSLLRFKSVCKSWCSLIKSSHFIAQHKNKGKHYNDKEDNFIVLNTEHLYDLDFSELSNFELSENLDVQCLQNKPSIGVGGMECYDGIVCLNHEDHGPCNISLWNPATRQFRFLPHSQLQVTLSSSGCCFIEFGFGFDFKTNDYKVVRFVTGDDEKGNRAEVYSLNNDSWTCLDIVVPIDHVRSRPRAPYRNGTTYCWLGNKYLENRPKDILYEILSFDFTTQVFGTIPMPNVPSFDFNCIPHLTVLRENIACINKVRANIASVQRVEYPGLVIYDWNIEIWVLNEYGVKESWTRLYIVGTFDSFIINQGIGFSKNGDSLLFFDCRQLCLCHLVTKEIKTLPIRGHMDVAVYKESLVSVESRKECKPPHSMRVK